MSSWDPLPWIIWTCGFIMRLIPATFRHLLLSFVSSQPWMFSMPCPSPFCPLLVVAVPNLFTFWLLCTFFTSCDGFLLYFMGIAWVGWSRYFLLKLICLFIIACKGSTTVPACKAYNLLVIRYTYYIWLRMFIFIFSVLDRGCWWGLGPCGPDAWATLVVHRLESGREHRRRWVGRMDNSVSNLQFNGSFWG